MNCLSAYSGAERRVNTTLAYWGPERRSLWNSIRSDERTLVERAARYDREAFARLYDRFVDNIYRYVYCKVGDQTATERLTAEVFVHALESINQYPWTDRTFAAWLYQIAKKKVTDYLHSQPALFESAGPASESGRENSVEHAAHAHFSHGALRTALDRLSHDQQLVVILRFLQGYSIEYIARLMGRHPGAVRTLQYRALVTMSGTFRKGSGQV